MFNYQLILDSLRSPVESYLLRDFAGVKTGETVLDIGCGNGFLTLSLACKFHECGGVTGLDILPDGFAQAVKVYQDLRLEAQHTFPEIQWVCGDFNQPLFHTHSFDVLVSNPPFFPSGSGRESPSKAKHTARMDDTLKPKMLFQNAARLLKPNGNFYLIYPYKRMDEAINEAAAAGLKVIEQKHYTQIRRRSGGIMLLRLKAIKQAQSGKE